MGLNVPSCDFSWQCPPFAGSFGHQTSQWKMSYMYRWHSYAGFLWLFQMRVRFLRSLRDCFVVWKSLYNPRANVPNCSHVPHPKTVLKMNPKDISCFLLFQKCFDKIKHLLESHALFPTAFPDQGPQTRKHRPRLQEDSFLHTSFLSPADSCCRALMLPPPLRHQQTLRIVRSVFFYILVMILSFFVAGLCHFLSFIFCYFMFRNFHFLAPSLRRQTSFKRKR